MIFKDLLRASKALRRPERSSVTSRWGEEGGSNEEEGGGTPAGMAPWGICPFDPPLSMPVSFCLIQQGPCYVLVKSIDVNQGVKLLFFSPVC